MAISGSRLVRTLMGLGLGGLTVAAGGVLLSGCRQAALNPSGRAPEAKPLEAKPSDQTALNQASPTREDQPGRTAELQQAAQQRGWREGHNATVACLHGERAQTDGNELRCEEQAYVLKNYASGTSP